MNEMRLSWKDRLEAIADKGSFVEFDSNMESRNPIGYPGYEEKIAGLQKETGAKEAIVTGKCTIDGSVALIGIMDSHFMMASMGSVVGEKIARLFENGAENKLPVVLFTASGGARMQEGMVSLMQMAKTAGAAALHSRAGQLYITVVCDPTTGGVQASFASLGDILIAEPGATIGFAGRRVIQDSIGQTLPDHFQTAEFILEHGFADIVLQREKIKETLSYLLKLHAHKAPAAPASAISAPETSAGSGALTVVQKLDRLRTLNRPVSQDYIAKIFTGFVELHGDRYFGDDPAVQGGLAYFGGMPVTVIAMP
jgi:acetyl-CoA carboxylase carboxyl transferase subunit beta